VDTPHKILVYAVVPTKFEEHADILHLQFRIVLCFLQKFSRRLQYVEIQRSLVSLTHM
jgi:hypothetical protein